MKGNHVLVMRWWNSYVSISPVLDHWALLTSRYVCLHYNKASLCSCPFAVISQFSELAKYMMPVEISVYSHGLGSLRNNLISIVNAQGVIMFLFFSFILKGWGRKQRERGGTFCQIRNVPTHLKQDCHFGFKEKHYDFAVGAEVSGGTIENMRVSWQMVFPGTNTSLL